MLCALYLFLACFHGEEEIGVNSCEPGLERNEQAVGVLLACSGARRVKEKPLFLKLNKGEATSSWIFLNSTTSWI